MGTENIKPNQDNNEKEVIDKSKRNFLVKTGKVAAGVAAAGVLSALPTESVEASDMNETFNQLLINLIAEPEDKELIMNDFYNTGLSKPEKQIMIRMLSCTKDVPNRLIKLEKKDGFLQIETKCDTYTN